MPQTAQTSALLTLSVPRAILRTALPSTAAMIASGLCALLDALLLGRDARLAAAVSVSFSLLTLIQTLGFTLGMGAGGFVSRSLGSGKRPAAYDAASTAFFCALLLSLALCVPGALWARPLVRLLGAPDALIEPACTYARFVLLTGPLLCASLVLSSLLRAQGKTIPNMFAFGLGAVVGLLLQFLLVGRLSFGVNGAGAAMLAREAVTLSVLIFAIRRDRHVVRPTLRAFSLRPLVFKNIMRSGLPTLVRQGLMSVSSVLLMRTSASLGDTALAGMGLAVRAASLVSSAVIGFGQGFAPVCGYAYGSGRMDRVREAYAFCRRWVCVFLLVLGCAVFFLARPLLACFSQPQDVSSFAASVLRAQSVVFFAQGLVIIMNMLTQAMGLTLRATLIAASRQGYVFIPLLLVLPRLFGMPGLILCQSVSDVLSLLLCVGLTRNVLTGSLCAREECSDARTGFR